MADKSSPFEAKYLGYLPSSGIWGHEYSDPPTFALLKERAGQNLATVVFEFGAKELKISEVYMKKNKLQKSKLPSVALRDVTFAVRMEPPHDCVVSTIYLGFVSATNHAVHVHGYVFKSPDMAAVFVDRVAGFLNKKDHQTRHLKMEADLVKRGAIQPSRLVDSLQGGTYYYNNEKRKSKETPPPVLPKPPKTEELKFDPDAFEAEAGIDSEAFPQKDYDDRDLRAADSLASELKTRLMSKEKAPMLLPPKDYDTVHRIKGDLSEVNTRRSLNKELVGETGGVYGSAQDVAGAKRSSSGTEEYNSAQLRVQKAVMGYKRSDPSRYMSDNPRDRLSGEPQYGTQNGFTEENYTAGSSAKSGSPVGSTGNRASGSEVHYTEARSVFGDHGNKPPPDSGYHSRIDNNFNEDEYINRAYANKGVAPAPQHKRLPRFGRQQADNLHPASLSGDSGAVSPRSDTSPYSRKSDDLGGSMPANTFNYLLGRESASEYAPKIGPPVAHKRSASGAT